MHAIQNFIKDESGQGMVEYGLILALIAIAAIGVLAGIGGKIAGVFQGADNELTANGITAPSGD